jgi:acyl-CoA dehydrogenase
MLELSSSYASSRVQFDRIIGTYQAVSHKVSDMYVDLELSRSLVIWAALSLDAAEPDADLAVASAAAKAIPAAVLACERAIQIHGGIGTTWESPLHLYYKRAMALAALDGPPARSRARVAARLFAG